MGIGDRLRAKRREMGLSAQQVAERLGLKESAVRHHENGTRGPKLSTLARYAALYGVSSDWLLRGRMDKGAPAHAEVIDIWDRITEEDRPHALAVLRALGTKKTPQKKVS